MDNISVMICDDSALMRNLIARIVDDYEGLCVIDKAENGSVLLEKLNTVKPDVILLDIEMPVMTGVQFLEKKKELGIDIPVIILSSIATQGAAITMKCLELGASDFITKPGGSSVSLNIGDVSHDIIEYISSYGGAFARKTGKNVYEPDFFAHQIKLKDAEKFVSQKKGEELVKKTPTPIEMLHISPALSSKKKEADVIVAERESGRIEIIAIGISTGGPNALREIFPLLNPAITQPILVVQHMPAGFTAEFASSLNKICPLNVSEAKDGEAILSGHIYIAPGNYHMTVEHHGISNIIRLNQENQRNGHRPSCDVMFESVANVYANHALGVIMTGMGRDGAGQLAEMRRKGAWTLGQDSDSSVVYGMPRVAWELGAVQKQVSLSKMAEEINFLALNNA